MQARSEMPEPAVCHVEMAIHALRGKWKMLILRLLLLEGPLRYNRLLEGMEGISNKVLSQSLRELAERGIVERRVLSRRPHRVEYAMTAAGMGLLPIFHALGQWSERLDQDAGAPPQHRAELGG